MSPFGANATSVGRLNVSCPAPETPLRAERHQQLAGLAQLVDDVARRVDNPDVAVRIDPDGVRAARVAAGRAVDGGVARGARRPVVRRDPGDLAVAEQPFTPAAHERAVRLEHQDRLRPAVQHQDVAVRAGRHGDHLAEVPGSGCAGHRRRRMRPLRNLGVRPRRLAGGRRAGRHECEHRVRRHGRPNVAQASAHGWPPFAEAVPMPVNGTPSLTERSTTLPRPRRSPPASRPATRGRRRRGRCRRAGCACPSAGRSG